MTWSDYELLLFVLLYSFGTPYLSRVIPLYLLAVWRKVISVLSCCGSPKGKLDFVHALIYVPPHGRWITTFFSGLLREICEKIMPFLSSRFLLSWVCSFSSVWTSGVEWRYFMVKTGKRKSRRWLCLLCARRSAHHRCSKFLKRTWCSKASTSSTLRWFLWTNEEKCCWDIRTRNSRTSAAMI